VHGVNRDGPNDDDGGGGDDDDDDDEADTSIQFNSLLFMC
jgi:hypothetical protein